MKTSTVYAIALLYCVTTSSCGSNENKPVEKREAIQDQTKEEVSVASYATGSETDQTDSAVDQANKLLATTVANQCKALQCKALQKEVVIAVSGKLPQLDPRDAKDLASISLSSYVFEGLPDCAEEVNILPDQKVYVFTLRTAQWSDGTPVTAHDFIATWKAALNPTQRHPNSYHLYVIENAQAAHEGKVSLDAIGIEAIDDQTLVVKLAQPLANFLETVASCPFFAVPQKIAVQEGSISAARNGPIASNGRYFVESATSDEIVLKKNHTYWNPDAVHCETLKFVRSD
ncbi:MAG TPA: ABC transporter substrate-binding protein, partial [Chlamydiales bacterium]|nr:ABC transporter substrate-binding protein [Chlamydiales bacterium]